MCAIPPVRNRLVASSWFDAMTSVWSRDFQSVRRMSVLVLLTNRGAVISESRVVTP